MTFKRWTKKEMQLIKNAAKQLKDNDGVLRPAWDLHNGGGLEHREVRLIVKKLRRAYNRIVKEKGTKKGSTK